MTNEQMKTVLAKSGVTETDVEKVNEKFDAEKITEIIETANNPKEAFENLHAFYPELEVSKLEEQMDFVQEQFEAAAKENHNTNEAKELSEEELDKVAGGAWYNDVGNWCSNNWKAIAVGAAIVVGTALICAGIGAGIGAVVAKGAVAAQAQALMAAITPVAGAVEISAASMAGGIAAQTAAAAGISALVGAAVGGVTTGVLGATGVLSKVN